MMYTSYATLNRAVYGAARSGNLELVQELIERGASTQFAFEGAARSDEFDFFDILCASLPTQDFTTSYVVESARAGNIKLCKRLLRHVDSYEAAFQNALRKRHYSLARRIRKHTSDTAGTRIKRLCQVIRSGNVAILQKSLGKILAKPESVPWHSLFFSFLIAAACRSGRLAMVKFIVSQLPTTSPLNLKAFGAACRSGNIHVAKFIFKKYTTLSEFPACRNFAKKVIKGRDLKLLTWILTMLGSTERGLFYQRHVEGLFKNAIKYGWIEGFRLLCTTAKQFDVVAILHILIQKGIKHFQFELLDHLSAIVEKKDPKYSAVCVCTSSDDDYPDNYPDFCLRTALTYGNLITAQQFVHRLENMVPKTVAQGVSMHPPVFALWLLQNLSDASLQKTLSCTCGGMKSADTTHPHFSLWKKGLYNLRLEYAQRRNLCTGHHMSTLEYIVHPPISEEGSTGQVCLDCSHCILQLRDTQPLTKKRKSG